MFQTFRKIFARPPSKHQKCRSAPQSHTFPPKMLIFVGVSKGCGVERAKSLRYASFEKCGCDVTHGVCGGGGGGQGLGVTRDVFSKLDAKVI